MYRKVIKRNIDVMVSLLLLPILLVIFIIVPVLVYFEDQGPVFYNAPRLGKNGKTFIMFKFRTMKINAPDLRNPDNSTYSAEDDPRVTKIGKILRKFSIDEFPQLINVLKGDMSLIGPRPHLPSKNIQGLDEKRLKRITVRPGITGYNQAFYRNATSLVEKIENDAYYVDHLNFVLDIKIFLKTILAVIKTENIYSQPKQ